MFPISIVDNVGYSRKRVEGDFISKMATQLSTTDEIVLLPGTFGDQAPPTANVNPNLMKNGLVQCSAATGSPRRPKVDGTPNSRIVIVLFQQAAR